MQNFPISCWQGLLLWTTSITGRKGSGPGRLVNTFSNKPEIDWEVGADKQLCSDDKEAKSQAVWPALYHWANPQCHIVYLLISAPTLPLLHSSALKFNLFLKAELWRPVSVFLLRRPLFQFLCISKSLVPSKWYHREAYSTEAHLFFRTFPFLRPIISEYSAPLSRQSYYRKHFTQIIGRADVKNNAAEVWWDIALWIVWCLTVNRPNYCSKTG